jgi:hypothetical protein
MEDVARAGLEAAPGGTQEARRSGGMMKSKVIVSSYPVSVVIGNYRWQPGMNVLPESEWTKVHWPTVEHDRRLVEPATGAEASAQSAALDPAAVP